MECAADYIAAGKDIVIALSAAAAAFFAYLGISAWRKELKGKAEYIHAKDLMKTVYKVREAFKTARNPLIFTYEYPDETVDQHGQLKNENKQEGMKGVYRKRLGNLDDAFAELEERHLEAQVEWGPGLEQLIRPLRECRVKLLVAVKMMLLRIENPRLDFDEKEVEKNGTILYSTGNDADENFFTRQINDAINNFEKEFRKYIGQC